MFCMIPHGNPIFFPWDSPWFPHDSHDFPGGRHVCCTLTLTPKVSDPTDWIKRAVEEVGEKGGVVCLQEIHYTIWNRYYSIDIFMIWYDVYMIILYFMYYRYKYCYFFLPHLCVGFLFLILYPASSSAASSTSGTHHFDTLSFTYHFVTHHLSHTIFDTPISHTLSFTPPSFTHNFVTHNFVTPHLSHTIFII